MRICKFAFIAAVLAQEVENENPEVEEKVLPEFVKSTITAPFLEQFIEDWKHWMPSQAKKMIDGVENDDLLQYRGEWQVESPLVEIIKNDLGLVLKTEAAHSAISTLFDKPLDPKGKTLVVQYEVKAQKGWECGGAYLKLLTYDKKFKPEKFGDSTPYTIMFGPDLCGSNNKVHFIFRHKNPITGNFEEKHLKSPPGVPRGSKTNLYTLIVRPDQTFEIKIDNEKKVSGSLLENFQPPVNPPKEIDDPEDKKPADWVDEMKIPDPDAKKPDDWDEDAPKQIVDESATMPSDWLVEEPEYIPDPEVEKPEDWDDEEDGDWTAPLIANPKCKSGCGEWKPPMIANPEYKGRWSAPMIDNPAYKGQWAPRQIPNPGYFEDLRPSDFTPMGGVGFELWSMQSGFYFDNIYIGTSEADAKKLAEETWLVKNKIEQEMAEKEKTNDKSGDSSIMSKFSEKLSQLQVETNVFIEKALENPMEAVKEMPHIAAILVLIAIMPILILSFIFGGKSAPKPKEKKAAKEEKVETEGKSTAVESKTATKRASKKD